MQSGVRSSQSASAAWPCTIPLFDFSQVSSRQVLPAYRTHEAQIFLPSGTGAALRSLVRHVGATESLGHQAVLQVLLARLLDIREGCIGIAASQQGDNRDPQLLPHCFTIAPQDTITEVIYRACSVPKETLNHGPTTLDVLLSHAFVPQSTAEHPLFQVQMTYKDHYTVNGSEMCIEGAAAPCDLALHLTRQPDGITNISLRAPTYLYSLESLHFILRAYSGLFESCVLNPDTPITQHRLYDDNDVMAGLVFGKGPPMIITETATLSKRIEQRANSKPDQIAIKDADANSLTYKQMQQHIQRAAGLLQSKGVQAQDCVAVYSIWRLNAIYVPLDPQNPVSRLQSILDDCRPTAIIYHDPTEAAIRELNLYSGIAISASEIYLYPPQPYPDVSRSVSAACVLYTSGSTGAPKGIVLRHVNLLYQILAVRDRFQIGCEIVLQQSSLGFDVSLDQMLQPLLGGGTLVVAPRRIRGDAIALSRLMLAEKVTYTYATPSEYMMLLRYGSDALQQLSSWRTAFVGGEALPRHLIQLFHALQRPGLRLINRYGPTEISISSSCLAINTFDPACVELQPISVGRTLPGYSTYILDSNGSPLPIGFTGEIVVSGPGVAKGYLHKDALTKQRFLPDPFVDAPSQSCGVNMYRTGDKGRLLPTGELVYLGRIDGDHQIKLRGYRIELDEIADTILKSAEGRLAEAVVSVRGLHDAEGDRRFLTAFVVPSGRQGQAAVNVTMEALDELVANLPLPPYMLPRIIIPVDELPRNPNGKLDRRAVDQLPLSFENQQAISSTFSDAERLIIGVWEQCLDQSASTAVWRLGTDFFRVGGNSLLMVKVQALLQQHLGRQIPLRTLFQSSTVEEMAALLTDELTPPPDSVIDWEQETLPGLDEQYLCDERNAECSSLHADGAIEVCLTGSTGFLGSALLQCLAADPRVARIHCSYRSTPPSVSAAGSAKLVRYKGDLTAPRLGLDRTCWQELAARVDLIIHNGADVSFLKSYRSLHPANVQSTRVLAHMALRRRIPFHFVSTADVARLTDLEALPPQSVAQSKPPVDGAHGYVASKWASEVYLERCATRFQLPCAIHRPTDIVGEGVHSTDFIQGLIQWSVHTRQVPALGNWTGFLDFVSVTDVARDITQAGFRSLDARRNGPQMSDAPSFHHHCSTSPVPVGQFREYLEERYGVSLRTVDADTWLERAREEGLSGLLEGVVAAALTDPQPHRMPRMLHE
ncbi:acetyl-CoA synthetase-like protein [Aspergillus homomorphus CBS 101889]|uniref:Acetyl-CoA synthetase-like protein n=1 Tax=Aspergillus homomorphus (strain CBS 101889) TaxID=1450537 RepID=A0A395HSD3_ASPHC|nr:acetyl-CoA synthetase-like protein [Aspergillus homomorphus CBS 101889]RAL10690.1 acetyl-CoA synthetase-like protein [Aspergillus homomorphus CBS 101889]